MADPLTIPRLSGQDLAGLRQEAGPSRTKVARRAAAARYTVSRWEQRAVIGTRQPAPRHLFEAPMPPGQARLRSAVAHTREDRVSNKLQQRAPAARRAAQQE